MEPWLRGFVMALGITAIVTVVASAAQTGKTETPNFNLAAAFQLPKLPGLSGQAADWRQWDSFFTFVVKRFGQDVPAEFKDPLGDAFLDSRYELTDAIAPGRGGDPVPELFLNGWKRLSPIMNKALPGLSKQTAGQYANFIGAADKLASFGGAGAQLGLVQLSPDALRATARILELSGAATRWRSTQWRCRHWRPARIRFAACCSSDKKESVA